ncbi:MAG: hypothetical protein HGA23_02140, partial [Bacteroidales bacterium]|nr:hypothetical protein [Bacteroidales bacterium]
MKYHIKVNLILSVLVILAVISCRRIEEYPPEPVITFLDFEKIYNETDSIYNRGILKFEFTDGDGDLGLDDGDTFPPFNPGSKYYYNLIIDYYEVRKGVETPVPITFYNNETEEYDTVYLSARIPLLTPKGSNKALTGEIYDTIFIYNYNSSFDTLFLKFR